MGTQSLTDNIYYSVRNAASAGWEIAQSCVGVRQNASTTEKVYRIYNASVAALVAAGWAYEIGSSVLDISSTSGPYESAWKAITIFLATGEYLSDAAFHAIASQVSESSSTEFKAATIALDILRLGIIGKLQMTQSPLSTIPPALNYTDIFNHLGNIAYNTGLISLFCPSKKEHNE